MLMGVPPYYDANRETLFKNIKKASLIFPKYITKDTKDFLEKVNLFLLLILVTLQKY